MMKNLDGANFQLGRAYSLTNNAKKFQFGYVNRNIVMWFRSSFSYWRSVLVALALNIVFVTSGQPVAMAAPPSAGDWDSFECVGINVPCQPGGNPPPARRGELILNSDFETGDYSSYGWFTSGNEIQIVSAPEPVCQGRFSAKFVLDYFNSPARNRTEFVLDVKKFVIVIGEEYWMGYATYVPSEIAAPSGHMNFHGQPDFDLGENWRIAPFDHRIKKDSAGQYYWNIFSQWSADAVNWIDGKTVNDGAFNGPLGPLRKGQWDTFVFHFRATYNPDGFIEVWRNGNKVISKVNIGTVYNDAKGPYLKLGIYHWQWSTNATPIVVPSLNEAVNIIYFDEIRIGGMNVAYDDVVPRCGS